MLLFVLEEILQLLHPFMPFITEEIWQHLPLRKSHLIRSSWPLPGKTYPEEEELMALLQEAITRIRNLRAEMDIPPSKKGRVFLQGPRAQEVLGYASYFKAMASSDELSMAGGDVAQASPILLDGLSLYLPLEELIDYEKEEQRLEKELQKVEAEIKRGRGKLGNPGFVGKAPGALVEKEEEKLRSFLRLEEELQDKIKLIKEKIQ